jgi:Flp pilus assembly protein TadD
VNFDDTTYVLENPVVDTFGNTLLQIGRAREAVAQYKRAFEINPDDVEAQNNMAWALATCPDAGVRNGTMAVATAERADSLTMKKSPVVSATLAAAYGETGRFADAVKAAERALRLAISGGIKHARSPSALRLHRINPVWPFVTAATGPVSQDS